VGTVHVDAGASGDGIIQASAAASPNVQPETIHREGYGEGELATVGSYFASGPGRVDVDGPNHVEDGRRLIDCEEDRTLWATLVGMLREAD
jgi:hypothetical protein